MSYHRQSRPAYQTDRQLRQRLAEGVGAEAANPTSSYPVTIPDTARDEERRNLDERPDTPRASPPDSRPETWAKGLNRGGKDGKQNGRKKNKAGKRANAPGLNSTIPHLSHDPIPGALLSPPGGP